MAPSLSLLTLQQPAPLHATQRLRLHVLPPYGLRGLYFARNLQPLVRHGTAPCPRSGDPEERIEIWDGDQENGDMGVEWEFGGDGDLQVLGLRYGYGWMRY
nr:hypothetical protein B0A51_15110 [Rachicladosporium sp. CCFEE 5018]